MENTISRFFLIAIDCILQYFLKFLIFSIFVSKRKLKRFRIGSISGYYTICGKCKKNIYIYTWFVNCSLFLWNSCVLSSRHRQRVPFSRSAKFFHSSIADRCIASLFRILAISTINDTCTFCAHFFIIQWIFNNS